MRVVTTRFGRGLLSDACVYYAFVHLDVYRAHKANSENNSASDFMRLKLRYIRIRSSIN